MELNQSAAIFLILYAVKCWWEIYRDLTLMGQRERHLKHKGIK